MIRRFIIEESRTISIHATHTGGDRAPGPPRPADKKFQSTPPIRVATCCRKPLFRSNDISIHATHTGGDRLDGYLMRMVANFNPRHPYGWRLHLKQLQQRLQYFNPRHPYGWRPGLACDGEATEAISTHATHTGGDVQQRQAQRLFKISIHATHTGGDPAVH